MLRIAEALCCSQGCCLFKSFLPTASRRPALAKATSCCQGMVNKRLWTNAIRASSEDTEHSLYCSHVYKLCVILTADRRLVIECCERSTSVQLLFFFLIFCKIFAWGEALVLGQTQDSQTCQPCPRVVLVRIQALCELLLRCCSCTEEVSGFQGVFTNCFFLVNPKMLVIYTASKWKYFSSWHHCSVIIPDNTAVFLLASEVFRMETFLLMPLNNINLFIF